MEDQGLVSTICAKMEAPARPTAITTAMFGASVGRDTGVHIARNVSIRTPHSLTPAYLHFLLPPNWQLTIVA